MKYTYMRKMEKSKRDRINAQKEKVRTGHSGPSWMPIQGPSVQKVCSKPQHQFVWHEWPGQCF